MAPTNCGCLRGRRTRCGFTIALAMLALTASACSGSKKEPTKRASATLQASLPIDAVTCISVTPDDRLLAAGSYDHTVRLWDLAARKELATLAGHTNAVCSVALSPDGKYVASASSDHILHLWDVAAEMPVLSHRTKSDRPVVLFSPDGNTLFLAGPDEQQISLWSVETQKVRDSLPQPRVASLGLSRDGRFLAAGGSGVMVWDLRSKTSVVKIGGFHGQVNAVALSPDGTTLLAGCFYSPLIGRPPISGDLVKLWSLPDGQELRALRGHERSVASLAVTSDGATLASSAADGTARLWEMATGREIVRMQPEGPIIGGVAILRDGKTVVTGGGGGRGSGGVQIWEISGVSQ